METTETINEQGYRELHFALRGVGFRMRELSTQELFRLDAIEDDTEKGLAGIALAMCDPVSGERKFPSAREGSDWLLAAPAGVFGALSQAFSELTQADPGN